MVRDISESAVRVRLLRRRNCRIKHIDRFLRTTKCAQKLRDLKNHAEAPRLVGSRLARTRQRSLGGNRDIELLFERSIAA